MSRWMRLAGAVLLGVAVVGCGANGGDPVAGQQVPDAPGSSSAADGAASGGGAQSGDAGGDSQADESDGGGGSGSGSGRKVGLPKSIRIPEIGEKVFKDAVAAACGGSVNGADGCLTVTYSTVDDPDRCGNVEWESVPPKDSSAGDGTAIVQRGATISATLFTCPPPEETTTEPAETSQPAPETPEPETETATETAAP